MKLANQKQSKITKKVVSLFVLLTLISLFPVMVFASNESGTVRFEPTGNDEYIIDEYQSGITFDVEIVLGSDDLFGWAHDENITFNHEVLQCTGVSLGEHKPSGATLIKVVDNEEGEIRGLSVFTIDSTGAVSGSGVAVVITFECIAPGESTINFTEFKLRPSPPNQANYVLIQVNDLHFECEAESESEPSEEPSEKIPPTAYENDTEQSIDLTIYLQEIKNNDEQTSQNYTFTSLDEVTIYGKVKLNQETFEGILVSFQVDGPEDSYGIHQVFRTSQTNNQGVALISFTIPPANSTKETVGNWTIYATTKFNGKTAKDSLTFQVEIPPSMLLFRELFILLLAVTGVSTTTFSSLLLKRRRKKQQQEPVIEFKTPIQTPITEPSADKTVSPILTQIPVVAAIPLAMQDKEEKENQNMDTLVNTKLLVDTIEKLESEKGLIIAEISELRKIAENRVKNLRQEIEELKELSKKLKQMKQEKTN